MHAHWTETTKRMMAIIGVLLGLGFLYMARGTVPKLVIAAVIAYALYPVVEWLNHRLRLPRPLATVLTYVLLILLAASVPLLVIPLIVDQVQSLGLNLTTLWSQARDWLITTLQSWRTVVFLSLKLDFSSLVDPALAALREGGALPPIPPASEWLPGVFGTLSGFATTVTTAAVAFFLTLVYSFYMVKDTPQWGSQLDQMVPVDYRAEISELRHRLAGTWGAFFRGQLLLCLIIAIMTFVVLTALGIRGAILLALLAGVLEVIPNLGPLLALIPGVLVALVQGSTYLPLSHGWVALIVFGAYILIQQIENNFLVPRVIGGSVDLPPLIILVGVVVGASNAGLLGAFLAAPVLASLRILAQYAYNKVLDRPPFPEPAPAAEEASGPPEEQPAKSPPVGFAAMADSCGVEPELISELKGEPAAAKEDGTT